MANSSEYPTVWDFYMTSYKVECGLKAHVNTIITILLVVLKMIKINNYGWAGEVGNCSCIAEKYIKVRKSLKRCLCPSLTFQQVCAGGQLGESEGYLELF